MRRERRRLLGTGLGVAGYVRLLRLPAGRSAEQLRLAIGPVLAGLPAVWSPPLASGELAGE